MKRLLALLVIAFVAAPGCKTYVPYDQGFTWKINVPERVSRGADLVFTIEVFDPEGHPAQGLSYFWSPQWVGLNGLSHKGKIFKKHSIRAKGSPGKADLIILTKDQNGMLKQVASASFEVF